MMIRCEKAVRKLILSSIMVLLAASCAGCHKIKKVFIKPPAEGVTQESYTIKVYAYDSSVVIKATPQKIIEYFAKDISRFERASGLLQIELKDLSPGLDMTEVGQSIDFNISILAINFPCRLTTLKYIQDKELWWMILTDGNWILARFDLKPLQEGSMLKFNVLGQPSKTMTAILDTLPLIEAVFSVFDLGVAFIQSEFDPELDVKELTEKGLRGEVYEEFLQAHDVSVWINASPQNVTRNVMAPDKFQDIVNMTQAEGLSECLYEPENRRRWEKDAGEPIFCPAAVPLAGVKWKFDSFTIINLDNPQGFLTIYGVAAAADKIFKGQLAAQPEKGGTRARMTVAIELPGSATPNLMSTIVMISGLPQWMGKLLLDIKAKVEGIG
jgi:hypothetical protein